MYGMIGYMQVVIYWPLLHKLKFPANLKIVNDQMIDLATYDWLPCDDFYP